MVGTGKAVRMEPERFGPAVRNITNLVAFNPNWGGGRTARTGDGGGRTEAGMAAVAADGDGGGGADGSSGR